MKARTACGLADPHSQGGTARFNHCSPVWAKSDRAAGSLASGCLDAHLKPPSSPGWPYAPEGLQYFKSSRTSTRLCRAASWISCTILSYPDRRTAAERANDHPVMICRAITMKHAPKAPQTTAWCPRRRHAIGVSAHRLPRHQRVRVVRGQEREQLLVGGVVRADGRRHVPRRLSQAGDPLYMSGLAA